MKKYGNWRKVAGLGAATGVLLGAGCSTDSGSKEFTPGNGWRNSQAAPVAPAIADQTVSPSRRRQPIVPTG